MSRDPDRWVASVRPSRTVSKGRTCAAAPPILGLERAKRGSSHSDRHRVVAGLTAIGGPGHPPTMSTVLELESAIRELPADEFWKLADWFDAARDEAWSKQMQADAEAGRLDFLFAEAAATQAVGVGKKWPVQA